MSDQVNHPSHYGGGQDDPYETIKVIEAWKLNFHLGNTVKYISRAGKKGKMKGKNKKNLARRLEDLTKAKWYLEREIENLKTK